MPTITDGNGQQHTVNYVTQGGSTIVYVDGQAIGDMNAYKNWLAANQPPPTTVVKSHRNDSEGYPVDENGNRTGDPQRTPVTYTTGTEIRDHQAGGAGNYTVGGIDDPANKVARPERATLPEPGVNLDPYMQQLQNRPTVQGPAASQIAQTNAPQAASVAQTALPTAAQIQGSAPTIGASTMPTINYGTAPTVDAYRPQTSDDTRSQQMSLAQMLQGMLNGGGETPEMLQARKDQQAQEAAQMSLAASAGPAGRAAALRSAMQNTAGVQASGQSEIAARQLAAKTQAQNTYASLLSGVRGQDISENENIANAENQARGLTAQLAGQQNVASIGAQSQLGSAKIGADTQRAVTQAQLQEGRAEQQASLSQQAGLASAAQQAENARLDATNQQQSYLQGSQLDATRAIQNAQLAQQSGQFGASLGVQQQGQNDQALAQLLNAYQQQTNTQQQGTLAQQQMSSNEFLAWLQAQNQNQLGHLASDTQLQIARMQQQPDKSIWDQIMSVAAPVLTVVGGAVGGPAGAAAGAGVGAAAQHL